MATKTTKMVTKTTKKASSGGLSAPPPPVGVYLQEAISDDHISKISSLFCPSGTNACGTFREEQLKRPSVGRAKDELFLPCPPHFETLRTYPVS